jgi:hypothetical protein
MALIVLYNEKFWFALNWHMIFLLIFSLYLQQIVTIFAAIAISAAASGPETSPNAVPQSLGGIAAPSAGLDAPGMIRQSKPTVAIFIPLVPY